MGGDGGMGTIVWLGCVLWAIRYVVTVEMILLLILIIRTLIEKPFTRLLFCQIHAALLLPRVLVLEMISTTMLLFNDK